MDPATRVQIPYEVVHILHRANTLGKGMNPTILPHHQRVNNFGIATGLGEKTEFKPFVLDLKIDLVSDHAHDELNCFLYLLSLAWYG